MYEKKYTKNHLENSSINAIPITTLIINSNKFKSDVSADKIGNIAPNIPLKNSTKKQDNIPPRNNFINNFNGSLFLSFL